ncbi:hypothetical protein KSF_092030 [Reticulibacter mediterranei]|uniref:Uncharacterized protein n=1 Tax=Reticulibacter mediterranei TaxID=2778369 RepID=A0A8J3IVB1_9CHLR|nr:hypothetical protein [Reticulibacter mediterranei]GHO99155.1 hypothetical protein KSF_092030 [Reticulibacter mediterranei]
MPRLNDLKAAIDDGKTAKHQQWRSMLHYLIRKEQGFYGRQIEGYKNEKEVVVVEPQTTFYATWDQLLASLNGFYTDNDWWLTDDKFVDYLPSKREEQ